MKFLIILGSITLLCCPVEAAWLDRKAEGWAWYEQHKEDMPLEQIDNEPVKASQTAAEELAEAKKLLEAKLAEALIHPSEENIVTYMSEQKKRLQQSAAFAHAWEKVLLQHPELDPTASSYPVNHYGIQLKRELDRENNRKFIHDLAQTNGLFFFYEGSSLVSQAVAEVIKKFSASYHWAVTAISIDGVFLDGFSISRADNGIAKEMGVSVFPALFVFNPQDKTATPIAYGVVSLDQIEERILLQYKTTDED